jgi:hypothetical protein
MGAGGGCPDDDRGADQRGDRVKPLLEHDGDLADEDVAEDAAADAVIAPRMTAGAAARPWSSALLAPVTQKIASPAASSTSIGRRIRMRSGWARKATRPAPPATATSLRG